MAQTVAECDSAYDEDRNTGDQHAAIGDGR